MKHLRTVLAAMLLAASGLEAQDDPVADSLRRVAETAPLFASHDVLEFRIEAPLNTIFKDRDQESEYHPGTLSYVDDSGDSVVLDMRARTRGYFRLKPRTCGFPNLHINFRRRQVENTVFAGQNRVSIVAHCQDKRPEYEQFTLQEYLIYRTFNLLTDRSVRVRLARATYIDTDGKRDSLTKYMFVLEPFDMLAARHGWEVLQVPAVPPSEHDRFSLPLVEVFQFLIGNTDWSTFQKSTDGSCCHNGKLIGTMAGPVIAVPYDFDWSGVISAPYARPAAQVGVSHVRQRRYWGICRPPEEFAPVFELFNERREAIYDLWRGQEGLEQRRLERTLEYFDEFYEIINDPSKTKREIVMKCRDVSYLGE
ncbi:MAG: hypothetical protein JSW71_01805 [Gemmatimonadota bacterium]|nr:MAG: hypothetical protein JSW71_01805 [Gemmatimonadota bacterium]